jgi:hypothetical protein
VPASIIAVPLERASAPAESAVAQSFCLLVTLAPAVLFSSHATGALRRERDNDWERDQRRDGKDA